MLTTFLFFTAFCVLSHSQLIPGRPRCRATDRTRCDFCLSPEHFADGTLRILSPGLYCLTSDIVFNPTANAANPWFPDDHDAYPGSKSLDSGAFALGFFAAITVETSNVIIDLLSHSISMHFDFYLQQRFYSHIEIANTPFMPDAGPAFFGRSFVNVQNITVRHGQLGLSSHHGIHSNNASNVVIHDLTIRDFEVGGIQLNGFHNVILSDLRIGPNLQNVPLNGTGLVFKDRVSFRCRLTLCFVVCTHSLSLSLCSRHITATPGS